MENQVGLKQVEKVETCDKINGNEQLQNGMRFLGMTLAKLLHEWYETHGNDGYKIVTQMG